MRRQIAVGLAATLALFGCGGVPDEAKDSERWTTALQEAIEPLPHVANLVDVGYSLQGPFNSNQAWIGGAVWSDTDDETVNLTLLDDVGRAVANAMAENPIADSWVRIKVVSASGDGLELSELGLTGTVTLDDLAAHYDIPRQK